MRRKKLWLSVVTQTRTSRAAMCLYRSMPSTRQREKNTLFLDVLLTTPRKEEGPRWESPSGCVAVAAHPRHHGRRRCCSERKRLGSPPKIC